MLAYKRIVTVKKSGSIVLKYLPLQAGQRVEVVVIEDEEEQKERIRNLRALLKETQEILQAKAITDDQIAEEVAERTNVSEGHSIRVSEEKTEALKSNRITARI